MNLILLFPDEWPPAAGGHQLRLKGERAHHIATVIKPNIGDQLRVGVLNGPQGTGRVLQLSDQSTLLEIQLHATPPPPPLPVTLLLALPRPKVLRRLLHSCTTLGVKEIYLINSFRVEKSYWQTPFLKPDQINKQLHLGLAQARDTLVPRVHLRQRFKPFVEDELPALAANKRCFTAHPVEPASSHPNPISEPSILAVGPEGGFIPYELEKLAACGFNTIALGPRILTVETAVTALISKLYL